MFFYLTTDYDVLWFPSLLKVILCLTENNTKYSDSEIKYSMASYAKVRTTRDRRVIEGRINFNAIHWISRYVVYILHCTFCYTCPLDGDLSG